MVMYAMVMIFRDYILYIILTNWCVGYNLYRTHQLVSLKNIVVKSASNGYWYNYALVCLRK